MKFLLVAINAKYIHSNLAIYSLRAYAGEGLRPFVELAEYTINQRSEDILADIYSRRPDAIGFSCYIWNWDMVRGLLCEIPKLLPETDIWLGGPEVTYDADKILRRFPSLAGIMVGEGEITFRRLLGWYVRQAGERGRQQEDRQEKDRQQEEGLRQGDRRAHLEEIPGLCLSAAKQSGDVQPHYTSAGELMDLNELPFPYEDLTAFEDRIIYYESSRGCPFRCSYCLSSIDKQMRFRDTSVVKKELQIFLDNRAKQVKFVDRTFNCNHEHAMAIWQYIYEHDNGVTNFHFEISADLLREDEVELLNKFRPGLVQLEIGVQSTNPKTIEDICRVMDLEKLERAVAAVRKGRNIHLHLDLIAGLPDEDYESFGHSFDRVYAMRPEQLQLGFLKVLKGSAISEAAAEYGICHTDGPPYEVLYTKWLSYEDVLRLKGIEEMVELYFNSNQFTHTIAFLEQAFKSPFAMFESLADFYREKGYFAKSPARARRYEILLEFAAACDGECSDLYRELLTFDMYLRENLKSRPAFAVELADEVKEKIREFYRREEQERVYLPAYKAYDWKQLARMTHLEPFRFPVWDEERMKMCRGREMASAGQMLFVLFDYRDEARNPLTYEAAVREVPVGQRCEKCVSEGVV